ncbi:MAG: hypothetical protein HUU21_02015 [Polyangiaceae bacterium]|nr:hypothetical protein [Polyangiaceae bacterium]NUQ72311.1 hypothetical protein [Polyangiaceae bacterium]
MWIEAIITQDDFVRVVKQITPVRIHFDDDDKTNRWLFLGEPTGVELVAEKGIRITCPAEIMWSMVGLNVPIKLHTLQVLLRPEIVAKPTGHVLAFNLELEEADFKGIPGLIDHGIMKAVNAALAAQNLAWDFTKTLTNTVKMPKLLDPIETLEIKVNWGKRRIDQEAVVLVVSFQLDFIRQAGSDLNARAA